MSPRAAIVLGVLLVACAGPLPLAPPLPPPQLPPELASCPADLAPPTALPQFVAADRLAQFAANLEAARRAERHRGDVCAETLRAVVQWIRETNR